MKTILAYNHENTKIIIKHHSRVNLFTITMCYLDVELDFQSYDTHDETMEHFTSLIKSPHTKEETE